MSNTEDTDSPYVECFCEGTTPGGWACRAHIQEDGDLLAEIENEYGLLLCGDCQAEHDNGLPMDEESWKESQWEWAMDR